MINSKEKSPTIRLLYGGKMNIDKFKKIMLEIKRIK